MRAALLTEQLQPLELVDDLEVGDPGPGQVRVEVHHCGLCHSDLSFMNGMVPSPVPIVLGHEASGLVTAVGSGVTSVAEGERVMLTPVPSCGACYWCVRDEHSLCVNGASFITQTFLDGSTGFSRNGETVYRGLNVGAFARETLALERAVVPLPDDVDLGVVTVIGCAVQTGVGAALNSAEVGPGDTVLVMGLGGIGISIVQGARIAGATRIIVSDPVAERREGAAHFGATDAIDPTVDDVVSEARRLTGDIGVDHAFDAVGSTALVAAGFSATRNGGTTVAVGAGPIDQMLDGINGADLMFSQKQIKGCLLGGVNSRREIPRLLELYRTGQLDLDAMVTAHRPIDEVNLAADDMAAGVGLRTVLDF
mgnify:CR=1 FL=1